MDVSVILCTYNRARLLDAALRSLEGVKQPSGFSWELLVVDNNSTDGTKAVVAAAGDRGVLPCRYLFESRQGKSHALNTGIAQAKGDILAFTDDDVTFDPGWLEGIWRAFEERECVGVAGRIVPVWSSPRPRWYADSGPYALMTAIVRYEFGDERGPAVQPPWGANMAYRRDAFVRHGGFDPRFGPMGRTLMRGEDILFARRLMAVGERLLYTPDAIVYHPVERERLTKRYFLAYYYQNGRMEVRMSSPSAKAVRWFGVPRHLVRALLSNGARWMTSTDRRKRFYYKLECTWLLGKMVEAYQEAHAKR
jgi:glucosyl-dolichyl phosphate glucuronosyltransferase